MNQRLPLRWSMFLMLLFIGLNLQAQTIWYVNQIPVQVPNGLSWTSGFQKLEFALNAASPGDQIWVKKGTYRPDPSPGRQATYNIPAGVAIYGGFDGTETQVSQRNLSANPTILSGDIGTIGATSDNCFHVVSVTSGTTANIIDGFTIQDGNADGTAAFTNLGGGLLTIVGTPVIRNCTFRQNYALYGGGAMLLTTGGQNPLVENCEFSNNDGGGGSGLSIIALSNGVSEPVVRACEFFDNNATSWGPALMFIGSGNGNYCNPHIQNCLVRNNHSDHVAGAVYVWGYSTGGSSPEFLNCTFVNNDATNFAGVVTTYDNGANPSKTLFKNCILWGNTANQFPISTTGYSPYAEVTFNQCLLQGSNCGAQSDGPTVCSNTVFGNPQFVNSTNDFHVLPGSPAIDAGNTGALPSGLTTDLEGNQRVSGLNVDLGCYEYFPSCHPGPIAYVNHLAVGSNDGSSWANAYTDLQDALAKARTCNTVTKIWVAEGSYSPAISNRNISFELVDQVEMYGGFPNPLTWPGGNPGMANRLTDIYVTALNGDLGMVGLRFDNSYHVVRASGLASGTVFDGFHVQGGYADPTEVTSAPWRLGYGGGFHYECLAGQVTGVTINDCRFFNNMAESGGGAISWSVDVAGTDRPVVSNCLFEGNIAGSGWGMGGAILVGPFAGDFQTIFESCTFLSNSSFRYGAGIELFLFNPTAATIGFEECVFEGNEVYGAQGQGALAIWSFSSALTTFQVDKCRFSNNLTTGLYIQGSSSTHPLFEVNNSMFFNNEENRFGTNNPPVTNAGGAIRLTAASGIINHCSFVSNKAEQGGAIYLSPLSGNSAELDIHNSIFWDNQVTWSNSGNNSSAILNSEPIANLRIDHSLLQGANCGSNTMLNGTGRATCGAGMFYNSNPNFVNQALGNLQLNMGSLAINNGDMSNSLPDDLDGNPRPTGAGVDMGCFESPFPSPPLAIAPSELGFKCYPNPVRDRLKISFEEAVAFGVAEVMDLNGKVLLEQVYQGKEVVFDLSDLSAGLYMIRCLADGESASQRIVVTH